MRRLFAWMVTNCTRICPYNRILFDLFGRYDYILNLCWGGCWLNRIIYNIYVRAYTKRG